MDFEATQNKMRVLSQTLCLQKDENAMKRSDQAKKIKLKYKTHFGPEDPMP